MGNQFSNALISSRLATPLNLMTAWFVPAQSTAKLRRAGAKSQQLVLPFTSESSQTCAEGPAGILPEETGTRASLGSGLRIVRVFDSAVSPSCAGRMVISGRMADVCAELERLSQAPSAIAIEV